MVPSTQLPVVWFILGRSIEDRFAVHVDGILASAADKSALNFPQLLREEIGQNQVTETDTTWILGMKVDHDREKKISVIWYQGAYVHFQVRQALEVP